ncbi:MAG: tagaturonate epimerase family protein [Acidobacteria bacterium]|nr:tagaturonate epimerase family protein [Acidobacteriota bacterium]
MKHSLAAYLENESLAPQLSESEAQRLAGELGSLAGFRVYPRSISAAHHSVFFLGQDNGSKSVGVLAASSSSTHAFSGERRTARVGATEAALTLGPATASNAAMLRRALPFLAPQPLGLRKSAGCGDRLGLATPGHIRAIRHFDLAPILAQQSMRENARTGRTPQEVMDDALFGVFQEGWRDGFGADADHLKTAADIDLCAAAGYTFYTIDPGEYVDNAANSAPAEILRQKVEALPWNELESNWKSVEDQLGRKPVDLGEFKLAISAEELRRAAVKYGRVVAHTVKMYRHLAHVMGPRPFELEMSVDETDAVTSLPEHLYIAHELRRLGVRCVSLAPRYVGTFEKGVDYIGNLDEFEQSFAQHLAVSKTYGPYKLSLHSGSDKFSVYPIAARVAGELVHLKTAGTSYLEALRAIAKLNPGLFREIASFAAGRYPTDRASYHVSAEVSRMPSPASVPDDQLPALLDNFDSREILHVTFGSVLNHAPFRESFFSALRSDEEVYYAMLETHFNRHLSPFRAATGAGAVTL